MTRLLRRLGLVALSALGAAACAAANDATTTNPAIETTTTLSPTPTFDMSDFTVGQVTNTGPLSWASAVSFDVSADVFLVEAAGRWFTFAAPADGNGGLHAWSSGDGQSWDDLGVVIPPGDEVGAVGVVGDTIYAAAQRRPGEDPSLWASKDGVDWAEEAIPVEQDSDVDGFEPQAIGGNDDLTVVVGRPTVDASVLIEEKVREAVWPDYDAGRFGLRIEGDDEGVTIDLLGPLGFSILQTTSEKLGISDDQVEAMLEEPPRARVDLWLTFGDGEWVDAHIDDAVHIQSIVPSPNGGLVASGVTELRQAAVWESFDGLFWAQLPFGVRPHDIARWNDLLVGPSTGNLEMLTSDDGVEWTESGLGALFPSSLFWGVPAFSSSQLSLSAVVEAFDPLNRSSGPDGEIPWIERDGLLISVEPSFGERGGGIRVFESPAEGAEPSNEVTTGTLWSANAAADLERMEIDLDSETIVLLADDDSPLTSVSFDELVELENGHHALESSFFARFRALAVSPGDGPWMISDLSGIEDEVDITAVGVSDSHVFVVLQDHISPRGFEIRSAPLS